MSDASSDQTTLRNGSPPLEREVPLMSLEDDDDPLSVKQLSLNFEYLMFKINDRIKTLSEQTEEVIKDQKTRYESDIEKIDLDLHRIEGLTKYYKQIMEEFVKIEQLSYIVKDFNNRLTDVENKMKRLK